MSKKLVPNIRFKGFDGEWNESLLNEKLIPSREKNTQEVFSKDDVLSVSGDYGVVNQVKFKGRSFAGVSVAPYGVVHTNDVVYTKSPLKKQPYGIIKTNKGIDGIVSTLYAIYSCAKGVYPNFVEDYFNSDERLNSYLRPLVRKGAKNDMKISLEGALAGKVWFPEYEEQKMISSFFEVLAKEIISVQTKLDKLYALKKTMLVKMFPQGDALVPEIRLKGFTGEWRMTELGKVSTKVTEKNSDRKYVVTLTNSAEYGIIEQSDFFDHTISNETNINGYYVVKPDDFVYNPRVSTIAPVGPINRNKTGIVGVMSPLYYVFRVHDIDLLYLEYFFKNFSWHRFMYLNGNNGARSDRFSISDIVFRGMPIYVPDNPKEQAAIGQYFQTLDKQLRLYEQKLSKLKNLKSAFLKNMFV